MFSLWAELCPPKILVEVLNPSTLDGTVFGDRAFKDIIILNGVAMVGPNPI